MCWNQTISLNTFIFTLFGINFAYLNNVITINDYIYYLSFSSIQLLEYFAWGNLDNKEKNRFLSQIGMFLIFIQPILFIKSLNEVEDKIKTVVIMSYLVFFLCCILYFPIDFSMEKAPNGHLGWNWLNYPPLIVFIWVFFYYILLLYTKSYVSFISSVMLFIAIYYTYYKTNTWGSLWCWIANIATLYLISKTFLNPKLPNCLLNTP
jgi:hypothetical protein